MKLDPRTLVVELIGTFFLVFTVGMVVIDPGAGVMAGLAIGTVLAVMIFAGGHISGGHFNPAVTLGVLLRGKTTIDVAVGYWVVQIVAAVLAAIAVTFMKPAMPAEALNAVVDDIVPFDKPFGQQNLRDCLFHVRRGNIDELVPRDLSVADSCEHIGDGIGNNHAINLLPVMVRYYQLALRTPGICPLYARSRKQMRQMPYLRRTACGRPQMRQRV
jgi:hypothetical protein